MKDGKMKKNTILCLLLLQAVSGYARETGTLTGRVTDGHTQQPLFGVNVVVLDTDRGASSDADGVYTIRELPVGTYRIRFSYIGTKPRVVTDVVIKSASPTFVNVDLEPEPIEGQGITVKAGYFAAQQDPQPSLTALSREEIRRFPGGFEDVVRTVSTLPGVAINMAGGRNDIIVRGGGPSENLYLINNIEIPNINHFGTPGTTGGSLSFVNLDFVDDVSFSTGGFGARYGDKMSSVVALTLVRKRPERFESKWTVSATQYGFNVETPLRNKGALILSARKSYLDLIFKAAGLPFIPVYTDYNLLLNYDLTPRDRLFLIGFSAIDNVDRNQETLENRVFNAGLLDNTQYKGITGINYRRLLPAGYMDVTASVNLSRFRLSQVDQNRDFYFRSDADEWESALKLQVFRSLGKRVTVLSGLSFKRVRNDNHTVFADTIFDRSGNRLSPSGLGLPNDSSTNATGAKHSGFLEAEWAIHPRVTVNTGIRADYFDFIRSPWYWTPRASIKVNVFGRHSLRASTGIYAQSPSYVWTVNESNRDLRALKNRMAVLGWDFIPREDTRISLEAYVKRYSDLPAGTVPGVNDYLVLTNTGISFGGREDDFQSFGFYRRVPRGKGRSDGAEFLVQKKFSDTPFYGLFGLAYNRTEFTAPNGLTYPGQYDQRVIFNLSGGYIFNDKWEFSAKFRYFTGAPYTPVYRPSVNPLRTGFIQNLPEEYLSARLGTGYQLDVRADRIFNFKRVTLIVYADVQNVTDFKVPMPPSYDFWTDKITNSAEIGILPSIGISLEI
jgi:hypothetical protein